MEQALNLEDFRRVGLDILSRVAQICEENGFRYVLAYGTLIGAIRHQGFVPWDDDIDIQMPRPDFDKLIKYMETHKKELGNLRVFNRDNNKKYIYGITRICNIDYEIHTYNEPDCGMGLFIDVYPLDGIGQTVLEAHNTLTKTGIVNSLLLEAAKVKPNYGSNIREILSTFKTHLLGKNYFNKKAKQLLSNCNYEKSKYLGVACWCDQPIIYTKDLFENRIRVKFEDKEFYAPRDYDYILRFIYGDYMKLPPVNERVPHHGYTAYRKKNVE